MRFVGISFITKIVDYTSSLIFTKNSLAVLHKKNRWRNFNLSSSNYFHATTSDSFI